jgi:hypothetical protein
MERRHTTIAAAYTMVYVAIVSRDPTPRLVLVQQESQGQWTLPGGAVRFPAVEIEWAQRHLTYQLPLIQMGALGSPERRIELNESHTADDALQQSVLLIPQRWSGTPAAGAHMNDVGWHPLWASLTSLAPEAQLACKHLRELVPLTDTAARSWMGLS